MNKLCIIITPILYRMRDKEPPTVTCSALGIILHDAQYICQCYTK